MRLLIDTHVVLWYIEADSQLPKKIENMLRDTENEVFVSIVSLFEVAIKQKIGKLDLDGSFLDFYQSILASGFEVIPISPKSLDNYQQIPLYEDHKDPFDRLLVTTAFSENMAFVSKDSKFDKYLNFIKVIW